MNPIVGASITVKGTSNGTITDLDGRFSLEIPLGTTQLWASYIGYIDQAVLLNNRSNITISLKENIELLDEVVVVGYEAGYTKKILKTLKKHHAKAIFFVTKDYIMSSPGLVKKMKKEGHLVGNHTTHHPRMAKLSVKRIQREIKECEKAMKKKTGFKMDPFIRPPEGNFSMRSIKVAKSMGYSTIFWSLAYYDYDTANQPGKNFVIRKFKTYYHNGMIPLIHACSKSNTEALGEVLTFLKKKGFRFGTLDEFAKNS